MYELFYKYLILNGKINLPGVGSFAVHKNAATIETSVNAIYPPTEEIQFSKTEIVNNKNLFSFLEKQLNINELNAISQFNDFSYKIKEDAKQAGGVHLQGIGTLQAAYDGEIYFVADENKTSVLKQVYLNKTIVPKNNFVQEEQQSTTNISTETNFLVKEEVTQTKKDYWWIYAIILTVIGIAALLYYYL